MDNLANNLIDLRTGRDYKVYNNPTVRNAIGF